MCLTSLVNFTLSRNFAIVSIELILYSCSFPIATNCWQVIFFSLHISLSMVVFFPFILLLSCIDVAWIESARRKPLLLSSYMIFQRVFSFLFELLQVDIEWQLKAIVVNVWGIEMSLCSYQRCWTTIVFILKESRFDCICICEHWKIGVIQFSNCL